MLRPNRTPRRVAMTTDWDQMSMPQKVENLNLRMTSMEDIGQTIDKIYRHLKYWGPGIIGALVTTGLVNGKVGAFISALFTGVAH